MKHFILAFMLALLGYSACYLGIEHWRARKGPWQVTFTHSPAHAPFITINQPGLDIANVQIVFTVENRSTSNAPGAFPADPSTGTALLFAQPRSVPCEVPFGRCVFLDLSSLPGTVTLDLFGHEIQLLPRVLIIDRQEKPWQHDAVITLSPAPIAPSQAQPASQ